MPTHDAADPSHLIIQPPHFGSPLPPPAFNVDQQMCQWTCEINSLRTPPLWVFKALRQVNIEDRGGPGDATHIVYYYVWILAKYLPSPIGS